MRAAKRITAYLVSQIVGADEVVVAGEGSIGHVGGVPVAGGIQGEDLPVALARIMQPVDEGVGLPGEASGAVTGRERENREENAGGTGCVVFFDVGVGHRVPFSFS